MTGCSDSMELGHEGYYTTVSTIGSNMENSRVDGCEGCEDADPLLILFNSF